jgi:hypothetical protein
MAQLMYLSTLGPECDTPAPAHEQGHEERRILRAGKLPQRTIEALRRVTMDERHAHLDSLMDD